MDNCLCSDHTWLAANCNAVGLFHVQYKNVLWASPVPSICVWKILKWKKTHENHFKNLEQEQHKGHDWMLLLRKKRRKEASEGKKHCGGQSRLCACEIIFPGIREGFSDWFSLCLAPQLDSLVQNAIFWCGWHLAEQPVTGFCAPMRGAKEALQLQEEFASHVIRAIIGSCCRLHDTEGSPAFCWRNLAPPVRLSWL